MRFDRMDDPIQGVGFVTIYFACLEDAVDTLLRELHPLFDPSKVLTKWQFGSRVEWLQKKVAEIQTFSRSAADESEYVDKVLSDCKQVATARNKLIHRPIFSDGKGGSLKKTRGEESGPVDIGAIYQLAEDIIHLVGEVAGLQAPLSRLVAASLDG